MQHFTDLQNRLSAQPHANIHRKVRSRAKRCLAWERHELASNGVHTRRLAAIALRLPHLTPTQLRVAALVSSLLPSWQIANILGTTEHSVENIRSRIRKRIGLSEGIALTSFLLCVIDEKPGYGTNEEVAVS